MVSANGSSVDVTKAEQGTLSMTLTGTGLSRVLLNAPRQKRALIDDQPVELRRAERPGCWWMETVLEKAGAMCRIEVR